jgi:hypothetical protein
MDELAGEQTPWDLDKHLSGCLAGYQTDQSYGAAVYFALEALGIAHDVAVRANAGKLDADQLDTDWIISPDTNLPVPWRALSAAWERYKTEGGPLGRAFGLEGGVPWIWIRALSAAWERYKTEDGPLGRAFGLEGGGQGKSPTIDKLAQMLDERAIARWIGSQLAAARKAKKKIRIEDIVQDAAEKFGKSDVTIRRAWQRFGPLERQRNPK